MIIVLHVNEVSIIMTACILMRVIRISRIIALLLTYGRKYFLNK